MINQILQGNCLDKLKELEDNSVDSIVTDPPYELGFMGKSWDNTGIANNKDMWAECLRVLKPGGHLLAFSGTRTYHRMASAIEDAGFEVRDMIEWVYGSGFPKSMNISKAIDKKLGAKREVIGTKQHSTNFDNALKNKAGYLQDEANRNNTKCFGYGEELITAPSTDEAKQWSGWGTALKPSHESICMARKPLAEKTVAENVLKYGTGGINIDESRVEAPKGDKFGGGGLNSPVNGFMGNTENTYKKGTGFRDDTALGRFPANIIHDNSEEVRECFPNESERFFKSIIYQAKASKSERNKGLDNTAIVLIEWSIWNEKHTTQEVKKAELLVDMGILQPKDTDEFGTQPNEGLEWNTYLFGKSLTEKYLKNIQSTILTETNSITTSQIFSWLVFLLTNEYIVDVNLEKDNGGNPAVNADNSKALTITMNEELAYRLGVKNAVLGTQLKISVKEGRSGHPTVKPIALMEYLIKMITPKGGIVLDPFAGSGSTLIAAKQNGFDYIGIELAEEYIPIIEARLEAANPQPTLI